MNLYGLKTCDTCRKARKALDAAGIGYTYTDVRSDGVSKDVLHHMITKAGRDAIVNTRSTTWRGLDADQRKLVENDAGASSLLRDHPTLMKRPIIVLGEAVHVGWTKEVQTALFV